MHIQLSADDVCVVLTTLLRAEVERVPNCPTEFMIDTEELESENYVRLQDMQRSGAMGKEE